MCVTDDEILKELKLKEFDKAEVEKEKRVRERERKRKEREERQLEVEWREEQSVKMRRPKEAVKKANPERVSKKKAGKEKASGPPYQLFTEMELHYGNSGGLWVRCDGFNQWFNIKCTNIKRRKVLEFYYCCS